MNNYKQEREELIKELGKYLLLIGKLQKIVEIIKTRVKNTKDPIDFKYDDTGIIENNELVKTDKASMMLMNNFVDDYDKQDLKFEEVFQLLIKYLEKAKK